LSAQRNASVSSQDGGESGLGLLLAEKVSAVEMAKEVAHSHILVGGGVVVVGDVGGETLEIEGSGIRTISGVSADTSGIQRTADNGQEREVLFAIMVIIEIGIAGVVILSTIGLLGFREILIGVRGVEVEV